ncbi:hypothetical protein [Chlamydia caviae]|uniref:Uncharacterized protein n=1 Tax=Chlamydia caviae (strain ATCC VR-813 / DSM 19441 / 03DC25 / GPIC) TaxID=227941 RepID=Q823V9_CHLCV|nr:hypothetical protein [Chlamydia caviae]AAP05045.1 conserved hypothetical protein [Chlamydia caviae GPIC]
MCGPIGSCSCKCYTEENSRGGHEGRDNHEASRPIMTQPGRQTTLELKIGDEDLLDTVAKAGHLVETMLSSPRTQRGATYCQEHCGPWCDSHCPNWLSHCFQCLCACVIDEPGPSRESRDLTAFLQSMRTKYGPVVLGLVLQQGGHDCGLRMAEGKTLNENEKTDFESLCSSFGKLFVEKLMGGIQTALFNIADDPEKIPSKESFNALMAQRGFTDFKHGHKHNPPTCWISHSARTEETKQKGAGGKIHQAKLLDFDKLMTQLAHLEVIPIANGGVYPLGREAETVCSLLKNAIYCLSSGAACFESPDKTYGLTFNHDNLLQLILLSLLAAGYVPTDKEFDPPTPWAQLAELSQFLRRDGLKPLGPKKRGPRPLDPDIQIDGMHVTDGPSSDLESEDDSASGSRPAPEACPLSDSRPPVNTRSWFSPEQQERLLSLSGKTENIFSIILG